MNKGPGFQGEGSRERVRKVESIALDGGEPCCLPEQSACLTLEDIVMPCVPYTVLFVGPRLEVLEPSRRLRSATGKAARHLENTSVLVLAGRGLQMERLGTVVHLQCHVWWWNEDEVLRAGLSCSSFQIVRFILFLKSFQLSSKAR